MPLHLLSKPVQPISGENTSTAMSRPYQILVDAPPPPPAVNAEQAPALNAEQAPALNAEQAPALNAEQSPQHDIELDELKSKFLPLQSHGECSASNTSHSSRSTVHVDLSESCINFVGQRV